MIKIKARGPNFPKSQKCPWLLPVNSCLFPFQLSQPNRLGIQCHYEAGSHAARCKPADKSIAQKGSHTHTHTSRLGKYRHTHEAACMMRLELLCGSRGWVDALVSSRPCPAGRSQYIPPDMQILWQSLRFLPLAVYSLCLSLALFLYPLFLPRGCNRPRSARRTVHWSGVSSGERCEEHRGAPMAPDSHLPSRTPSTTSRTSTANPFLFLSPCLRPSRRAGPQSTRSRRSGGRRCPATTSPPRPWTCAFGPRRTKVRRLCRRSGRWPTRRRAWFIS